MTSAPAIGYRVGSEERIRKCKILVYLLKRELAVNEASGTTPCPLVEIRSLNESFIALTQSGDGVIDGTDLANLLGACR
jgi:hypothetical protein